MGFVTKLYLSGSTGNPFIMNRLITFIIICLSVFILSACQVRNNSSNDKPNIIYILADDMGYGDASSLNPDSKILTPKLDTLARQGITFTDAHASSALCSPTRYGLLTGRYSWRSRRQGGALWSFDRPLIEEGRLTVAQFLKDNGYHTACIGKWHLGLNWRDKDGNILEDTGNEKGWNIDFSKPLENGPLTKGFDYFFGMDAPNYPPYCYIENDKTIGIPNKEKPVSMYGVPGIMLENWDLFKVLPEMEDRAIQYIRERAKDGGPFFLYFPLTAPHLPIVPTEEFVGKSDAGLYGDFICQVDAIVGNIMNTLDQTELTDNTLVIFTSDNGSIRMDGSKSGGTANSVLDYGHNPSYIFRGVKADVWEGGHRVPFFASWPARISPGSISSEVICHTDLFATVASILGKKVPENAAEDSYNLLPVLTGEKTDTAVREAIVHLSGDGSFSIRKGSWKLEICPGSGGASMSPETAMRNKLPLMQLYNLDTDIEEQINLYNNYPDKVFQLTSLLEEYVSRGRSTPGAIQENTGSPDIWRALNVRDVKYDTTMLEHLAIGKDVRLLKDVPLKFTKSGIQTLTDGVRASSWYNDGYWVGLEGENLDIMLDLGEEKTITSVSAGFLEAQAFWIFHPDKINFSFSSNGIDYPYSKELSRSELVENDERLIKDFTIDNLNEKCRYIRIQAKGIKVCPTWHKGAGGKAWMLVDEVVVQ